MLSKLRMKNYLLNIKYTNILNEVKKAYITIYLHL